MCANPAYKDASATICFWLRLALEEHQGLLQPQLKSRVRAK